LGGGPNPNGGGAYSGQPDPRENHGLNRMKAQARGDIDVASPSCIRRQRQSPGHCMKHRVPKSDREFRQQHRDDVNLPERHCHIGSRARRPKDGSPRDHRPLSVWQVTVHVAPSGGVTLDVEGALTALIEAAQPGALVDIDHGSVKLVAGACNSRFLRLVQSVVPRLAA
jgi:hypothetical protein